MANHPHPKRPSTKRRWMQRRKMGRMAFTLLIAMLVARSLLFALDWVSIALIDLLGANITAFAYAGLFILFGWKLHSWINIAQKKAHRKGKAPQGTQAPTVLRFQTAPTTPAAPVRRAEP